MQMERPKVLVCVLTSYERHGWVNPGLVVNLISLAHHPRYRVLVQMIVDKKPHEHARNYCVTLARDRDRASFLLMIDNDEDFLSDPMRWIREDKDVLAIPAVRQEGEFGLQIDIRGQILGADVNGYAEVERTGTGAMILNKRVWERIPKGPWFKHIFNDNELRDIKQAESFYFCDLVRKHGMHIWVVPEAACHFHTTELASQKIHLEKALKNGTLLNGWPVTKLAARRAQEQ